jgi:hypothetical protein
VGLSMIPSAHAGSKAGEEIPASRGIIHLLVAVWSYALLSGVAAFALIQILAAVLPKSGPRLSLQLLVIPAVAVMAGTTYPRVLAAQHALFARRGR